MSAVVEIQEGPGTISPGPSWSNIIIRDYQEWTQSALCSKHPSIAKKFRQQKNTSEVKIICNLCPVIQDCLYWAVIYDEKGIWGGTTRGERNKLFSKHDRDILINIAKTQKQYYERPTPGDLIKKYRQFIESLEEH